MYRPGLKPRISQIQVRSVTAWMNLLGLFGACYTSYPQNMLDYVVTFIFGGVRFVPGHGLSWLASWFLFVAPGQCHDTTLKWATTSNQIFCFPAASKPALGPIRPPTRWINLGIVKLMTPRHLLQRLRMPGSILPLRPPYSWHDAQGNLYVAFGGMRTDLTVASLDKPLLMNIRRILNVMYNNLCSWSDDGICAFWCHGFSLTAATWCGVH
jgi:hypothetical protein